MSKAVIVEDRKRGWGMQINWHIVDQMLMAGMDGSGVANRLGIHYDTLYNKGVEDNKWGKGKEFPDFSAYRAAKRAIGDQHILERQYMLAMGIYDAEKKKWIQPPNVTMLIWLGKQRCQQYDQVNLNSDNEPLVLPTPQVTIIESP